MGLFRITGADPVADTGEPFGIFGGFGVDEEARLLASVAQRPECVVSVPASTALPIPFSGVGPFSSPHPSMLSLSLLLQV